MSSQVMGTIGYRQNNPLNMRPLGQGQLWHGQAGIANGFCVFLEPRWCFRAWLIEARTYKTTWKCVRVLDWIKHYAPPEDNNDPMTYTRSVEKFMGLSPDEIFNFEDRKLPFCQGQMIFEIGGIPYSDMLIEEGFSWTASR